MQRKKGKKAWYQAPRLEEVYLMDIDVLSISNEEPDKNEFIDEDGDQAEWDW